MTKANETNIDIGVLSSESADEHHARAAGFLSSHQLIDFMKCPWLHFKKHSGLIQDKDSTAYLIGQATHSRILEGRDVYEASFAMGSPVNPNTGRPFGTTTGKPLEEFESQARKYR